MLRILSSVMIGFVCDRGGRFFMILMIFFCALMIGCMYVFVRSLVPQTVIAPIKCGKACM